MNITNRTTHDVQQGTGPWLRLREDFDTASEAPAALGVGKYTSRAELLRRKSTGVQSDPDAATLGRFSAGHAAEAAARPLAEVNVGGELFPTTMSAEVDGLRLLASLDGQTLLGDLIWETKLWNEELAAAVRQGAHALPEHYAVQMDQELLVSGADACLFTCTDGTPERYVACWYKASPERFAALVDGWRQFKRDLAAYTLPEAAEPAPVGRAPDTLPALRIEVTGKVTASNLAEFKATALAAIQSVNRNLKTDADFADADKAVKWCADVESRIKAAKEHALSQTSSIDELFKTLDDISAESKRVRLDLDKLVTRRKSEVKDEAVTAARRALDAHIAALNAELAPMRLQPVVADFPLAIKGLRSIASMQDALDTTLAGAKIAADAQARSMRANLFAFKAKADGFEHLFADLSTLVHKPESDFCALIDARITTHKAAEAAKEAKRQADEAARIAEAEQRAREQEAARIAEQQRQQAAEELAAQQAESARLEALAVANRARLAAEARAEAAAAVGIVAAPAQYPAPAYAAVSATPVRQPLALPTPPADEPATLKLGAICGRLGFTVSAAFVADVLHVAPARTEGRAVLYRESQWPVICKALASHVGAMAELYAAEPA